MVESKNVMCVEVGRSMCVVNMMCGGVNMKMCVVSVVMCGINFLSPVLASSFHFVSFFIFICFIFRFPDYEFLTIPS